MVWLEFTEVVVDTLRKSVFSLDAFVMWDVELQKKSINHSTGNLLLCIIVRIES